MPHNHNHNCTHDDVKYCSHCRTVYCKDCNTEWVLKSLYGWTNNLAFGIRTPYASGGVGDSKALTSGTVNLNHTHITTTNDCEHSGK